MGLEHDRRDQDGLNTLTVENCLLNLCTEILVMLFGTECLLTHLLVIKPRNTSWLTDLGDASNHTDAFCLELCSDGVKVNNFTFLILDDCVRTKAAARHFPKGETCRPRRVLQRHFSRDCQPIADCRGFLAIFLDLI
jgi:hypothetical protein